MAQPIALEIPPRNPRADLRSRVERAPEEHAEAVLAAYELLQELHNQGVLDIMRSALAARDELLEKVVDKAKTPEAIRGIRKLLYWRRILGSIEPEWFPAFSKAIPEGLARARRTSKTGWPVHVVAATDRVEQSARIGCGHRLLAGLRPSPPVRRTRPRQWSEVSITTGPAFADGSDATVLAASMPFALDSLHPSSWRLLGSCSQNLSRAKESAAQIKLILMDVDAP